VLSEPPVPGPVFGVAGVLGSFDAGLVPVVVVEADCVSTPELQPERLRKTVSRTAVIRYKAVNINSEKNVFEALSSIGGLGEPPVCLQVF
jgi:hypothetical protein